jgi:hypothetical protein
MGDTQPIVALSIRQPWAWLIVNGWKDIENRSWPTRFRGKFLVHAGKSCTQDDWDDCFDTCRSVGQKWPPGIVMPDAEWFRSEACGGIVGRAEIVDCVTESASPWFFGRYGFVLRNAAPTKIRRCKGRLGLFAPQFCEAA